MGADYGLSRRSMAAPTIITYVFFYILNIYLHKVFVATGQISALFLQHQTTKIPALLFEGLPSINAAFKQDAHQSFRLLVIWRRRLLKWVVPSSVKPGKICTQLKKMDDILREYLWEIGAWVERYSATFYCIYLFISEWGKHQRESSLS